MVVDSADDVTRLKMAAMLAIHHQTSTPTPPTSTITTTTVTGSLGVSADPSADPYRLPESPSPPIKQPVASFKEQRKDNLPSVSVSQNLPSSMTDKQNLAGEKLREVSINLNNGHEFV